ncbi:hypothetical protein HDU92_006319 [Lobulomyces angularis]|nr:hypothetical protein HDU92_006319 [Lobulomyces angularis]
MIKNLKSITKCLWENCSMKFTSEEEAYHHLNEMHTTAGVQQCKWNSRGRGFEPCNLIFQHRGHIKDHSVVHFTSVYPKQCDGCGEKMKNRQNLHRHRTRSCKNLKIKISQKNLENNEVILSPDSASLSAHSNQSSNSNNLDLSSFNRTSLNLWCKSHEEVLNELYNNTNTGTLNYENNQIQSENNLLNDVAYQPSVNNTFLSENTLNVSTQ